MDLEATPIENCEITMTYDELFNNSFGISPSYLCSVLKVCKIHSLFTQ